MRLKQIFSSVLISATLLPVCSGSIVHASDINSVNIYTNNKNVNHNSYDLNSDKDKTTTTIGLSANSDVKSDTANKAELQQIAENLASDGKNSTMVTVTAGKKDTLLSICNDNYANIYQTAKLNHLSPTADLKSGQEIKLIANQKSDQIIVNNDHLIKDLIIEQKTENKAVAKARKIVAQEKAVQAEREKDQDAISDANDSLSRLNDALAAGDKQVKADGYIQKAKVTTPHYSFGNVDKSTQAIISDLKKVDKSIPHNPNYTITDSKTRNEIVTLISRLTKQPKGRWATIIYRESSWRPFIVNDWGYSGLAQLNSSYPGAHGGILDQIHGIAWLFARQGFPAWSETAY